MRRKQSIYSNRLSTTKSLPSVPMGRRQRTSRRSRTMLLTPVLIVATVAILTGIALVAQNRQKPAAASAPAKSGAVKEPQLPVVVPSTTAVVDPDVAFMATADDIISRFGSYRISVSVHDFATGKDVQVGSKERFRAASTAKLITATDYMSKVEAGSVSLDTVIAGSTARTHLYNMLVLSDNASWNAVNEYMTLPDLTSFASRSLGIQGYDRPANMLRSDETNGILARLYGGSLLNKPDTTYLLSLMKQANYRSYILPSVSSAYTVYHKAGFYLGHEHDAAIIVRNSDSKAIALTIYTYGNDASVMSKNRTKAFADLTAAALDVYFP